MCYEIVSPVYLLFGGELLTFSLVQLIVWFWNIDLYFLFLYRPTKIVIKQYSIITLPDTRGSVDSIYIFV